MFKTIILKISLQGQGLNGVQALEISNAIEEQIEDSTNSEVVGGGIATDGSEIDLQIKTSDIEALTTFIKSLMEHAELDEKCCIEIA